MPCGMKALELPRRSREQGERQLRRLLEAGVTAFMALQARARAARARASAHTRTKSDARARYHTKCPHSLVMLLMLPPLRGGRFLQVL